MLCQGNCRHFHQKMRQEGLMPRGASSTNLAPNFPPEALRDLSCFERHRRHPAVFRSPSREAFAVLPQQGVTPQSAIPASSVPPTNWGRAANPLLHGPAAASSQRSIFQSVQHRVHLHHREKFSLISVSNKPWPKL